MFVRSLRSIGRFSPSVHGVRYNSTASSGVKKATFRQLFTQPIFKSIFLTLLFASITIDLMKNKKRLESLESTYKSKLTILEDIVKKLENGETINLSKELLLANSLTRKNYNSVTDIDFDEQLEKFIQEASGEPPVLPQKNKAVETVATPVLKISKEEPRAISSPVKQGTTSERTTSKFL